MKDIASKIDHTCLGKDLTIKELEKTVEEAKEYSMNICIPPFFLEQINSFPNKISTVIGFPLGFQQIRAKNKESITAIQSGADEIDYCCNITYIKEKPEKLEQEARTLGSLETTTKAIIETGLLTNKEIKTASKICSKSGVDYIKTCSGFTEGQARVEDVKLIRNNISSDTKIKASGGIGTYEEALDMIEAGADRIGASSGVKILKTKGE